LVDKYHPCAKRKACLASEGSAKRLPDEVCIIEEGGERCKIRMAMKVKPNSDFETDSDYKVDSKHTAQEKHYDTSDRFENEMNRKVAIWTILSLINNTPNPNGL